MLTLIMRRLTLLPLALMLCSHLWADSICKEPAADVFFKFISEEVNLGTGTVDLRLELNSRETVIWEPEGFSVSGYFDISSTTGISAGTALTPGNPVTLTLTAEYALNDLPYYAHEVEVDYAYVNQSGFSETAKRTAVIYFTPYSTIEIWDEHDAVRLNRIWQRGAEDGAPARQTILQSAIPTSDIPAGYEQGDDEAFDYETVDGLAYAVPRLYPNFPGYPVDTSGGNNRVNGDFNGRLDNLKIFTFYRPDNAAANIELGLRGATVEVWRERNFWWDEHIDTYYTDNDGFVVDNNNNRVVDFCTNASGNNIDVYLKIKMKDRPDRIRAKHEGTSGSSRTITTPSINLAESNTPIAIEFGDANSELELQPRDLGIAFTWAKWLKAETNAELIPLSTTVSVRMKIRVDDNDGTSFYRRSVDDIFLDDTDIENEFTMFHEYGHYVDDQVFNVNYSGVGGIHWTTDNNQNTIQTMVEGWGSGFAFIMDELLYGLDNESGGPFGPHRRWAYSLNNAGGVQFPDLTTPYLAEMVFAQVILDLWDGQNNFSANGNPTWGTGNTDDENVEMSFADLIDPLVNHPGAPYDMLEYFNLLLTGDCEFDDELQDLFYFNFSRTSLPLDDINILNTDEITRTLALTWVIPEITNDVITGTQNLNHTFLVADAVALDGVNESYNITRFKLDKYNLLGQLASTVNRNFSPVWEQDDLIVRNGATLQVHGNGDPQYYQEPDPNNWTYTQYSNHLNVDLCGQGQYTIDDQGTLELGSVTPYRTTHFRIKEGSRVVLNPNSQLIIRNNSRLVIEEGAELVFEAGASILLEGNGSILEIDGDLHIGENAVFTFNGDGHILFGNDHWNETFYIDPTASIELKGAGPTDLILVVKNGCHFWADQKFDHISITKGRIEMGTNANILVNGSSFVLEDIVVDKSGTSKHGGLITAGQPNHTIKNVEINNASTGLRAVQFWGNGGIITITQSSFNDCDKGLKVEAGGVKLVSCSFTGNQEGYYQDMGNYFSQLISTDFNNNVHGVRFNSSGGDLNLNNSDVLGGSTGFRGVQMNGPGTLRGKCAHIEGNSYQGIGYYSGASLDLSDNFYSAGAQWRILNNGVSIYAFLADEILLNEGKNDLIPAVENQGNVVQGYFIGPNINGPHTFPEVKNHWNTRTSNPNGASPAYNTDYETYVTDGIFPSFIANLYFTDAVRSPAWSSCSYGIGNGNGGGGGSNKTTSESSNPLYNCNSCRDLETPNFEQVSLNEAIKTTMGFLEALNSEGSDGEAYYLMYEILTSDLSSPSDEERKLIRLGLDIARMAFRGGLEDGSICATPSDCEAVPDQLEALKNVAYSLTGGEAEKEMVDMDRAMADYAIGDYPQALLAMAALKQNVNTGLESYLSYAECYIDAQQSLMDGTLNLDGFISQITYCHTLKSSSDEQNSAYFRGLHPEVPMDQSAMDKMDVYPNPTNEEVFIRFANPEVEIQQIIFVDIAGKVVGKQDFEAQNLQSVQYAVGELAEGVYLMEVKTNQGSYHEKLVVRR